MAKLVFGMNQSLDGFVDHLGMPTGPALFRHFLDVVAGHAGAIYGRRIYEVMRYWDVDRPAWDDYSAKRRVTSDVLRAAGQQDRLGGGTMPNLIQDVVEVFVCHPVVESAFGCRAHHYDHLLPIEPELC